MVIFRGAMIFPSQVLRGGLSKISPDEKEGIRGAIKKNSIKAATISLLIFSRRICK